MQPTTKFRTVDAYLSSFPEDVRIKLEALRATIRKAAAPQTTEMISYNMPAYKQHGLLVYFAGYTNHIGFYPTASGICAFQNELAVYKFSSGSVQFPIDRPVPLDLVARIVKFRLAEDSERAARNGNKRRRSPYIPPK